MSTATIPQLPLNATPPTTSLLEISNAGVSESTTIAAVIAGLQVTSEKGVANGYASLDASALVPIAQIPDITSAKVTDFDTQVRTSRLDQMAIPTAALNINSQNLNNILNADIEGFIDLAEIATPANPGVNIGRLYVEDVAGTTTLFFRDNAGTATNLLTPGGATSLNELTDVTIAAVADTQILIYDSTSTVFENHTLSGDATITNTGVVSIAAGVIDNANLASGVFAAITGIGTQSQALNMNGNGINNGAFFESNATNPADAGIVRLGNTEQHAWRNAANNANITMQVNATDQFEFSAPLLFNNIPVINDGITFTFNPNASVSGVNVGAHTADPSTPVNGDLYYNSTANELRARINGAWVNLAAAGGSDTPWTENHDFAGFITTWDASATNDITTVQTGDLLVTTVPDNVANIGIQIGNANGHLQFVNGTVTAGDFQPTLTLAAGGGSTVFNDVVYTIPVADDTGTVPVVRYQYEQDDGTILVNRPLFDIVSQNSTYLTLQRDATWDFLDNSVLDGIGAIYDPDFNETGNVNDFLRMGSGARITWDSGSNVHYYTTNSTQHQWYVNNTLELQLTATALALTGGKEVQSINNLQFLDNATLPAGTVTYIQKQAATQNFNVPNGDTYSFRENGTVEYTLSDSEADWLGNNLRNVGFFESNAANPSDAGAARFGDTEVIAWRNAANNANHTIGFSADVFQIVITSGVDYSFSETIFNVGGNFIDNPGSIRDSNSNELLTFAEIASAVNNVELVNAATGNPALIRAVGDDANVDLQLESKGTGTLNMIDSTIFSDRIQGNKGSDVASADAITLGAGNYFDITGVTTINHMLTTNWQAGSIVTLQFDASLTVTNAAGGATGDEADFALVSASNFAATAGDTLTLVYDGTVWREVARSVN